MCGACGAGSARSATHWSAAFLASVPARSAAAGTLTRWARASGWSGTVSGVAGDFQVATASGRRSLALHLAGVMAQLEAYGVRADRLLDASGACVVEGPATLPGLRPRSGAPHPEIAVLGGSLRADGKASRVLPTDPRRRYRVPGLLAWLSVAEWAGALGPATVHLGLGASSGILVVSDEDGVITCEATPAPREDVLTAVDRASVVGLVTLLCPAVLAPAGSVRP